LDEVVGTGGAVYSIGAVAANGHHVECHTVGPVGYKMAKAQIVHTLKKGAVVVMFQKCTFQKCSLSENFKFTTLTITILAYRLIHCDRVKNLSLIDLNNKMSSKNWLQLGETLSLPKRCNTKPSVSRCLQLDYNWLTILAVMYNWHD
jgi:hypothetical protein